MTTRFSDSSYPVVVGEVAYALTGKALALEWMEQYEESLTVYDEVIARFGDSSDPLEVHLAVAMTGKGVVLSKLGRLEEALTTLDQMVTRF